MTSSAQVNKGGISCDLLNDLGWLSYPSNPSIQRNLTKHLLDHATVLLKILSMNPMPPSPGPHLALQTHCPPFHVSSLSAETQLIFCSSHGPHLLLRLVLGTPAPLLCFMGLETLSSLPIKVTLPCQVERLSQVAITIRKLCLVLLGHGVCGSLRPCMKAHTTARICSSPYCHRLASAWDSFSCLAPQFLYTDP